MASGAPAKTCVLCGEDCSTRARIKDPKGRYYCRACYEKERAARAQPAAASCPGCGRALPAGAVLCTSCGFNLESGRQLEPQILAAPAMPRKPVWPLVVGIISVVLGGGGTIANGLNLAFVLTAALSGDDVFAIIGALGAASLLFVLALWLLLAGIGILRRMPRAAASIRRWALVKGVLCLVCFGLAFVSLFALPATLERMAAEMGDEPGSWDPGLEAAALIVMVAWQLVWPIFVIAWFSRRAVQEEVRAWR